jgi:septal ring factor EnvC (AmiA/AmiB activator)
MLRFVPAALLIAAGGALSASVPGAPANRELAQAQRDVASARTEQQRLEKIAEGARDELLKIRARQLAAAQAIAATEAEITLADSRARLLEDRLDRERRMLAAQQAPVTALLAALVLKARRPPLLAVADSGSAEDLVKLRLLTAAIAPAIRARTAALSAQLDRESRLQNVALAAVDDGRRRRSELASRRDQFAALERQAADLAGKRGAEALGAGDEALASQQRLSDIAGTLSSTRESSALAGELEAFGPAPLPAAPRTTPPPLAYQLPARAALVDGLGSISAGGVRSRGVTLDTRRGAALVAPADGTVLFSGPFRDYDGVVVIDHGRGWKSVLVNAGSKLKRGDRVRRGEPLGIALGRVEVQLHDGGKAASPALIAGSSAMLSNQ